jgi:hypothetical protein
MDIRQITGAIFLYAMIAGYLFLGVGILVKAIFSWTGGGRRARLIARDMKRPVRQARDNRRRAKQINAKEYPLMNRRVEL